MRILTFREAGTLKLGVKTARGVLDVAAAAAALSVGAPATPGALYAAGLDGLPALAALAVEATDPGLFRDENALTWGPAVPAPGKILCVGLNYRAHAAESGKAVPAYPVLFSKFNTALNAHRADVVLTGDLVQADYEAELAVVIGRKARGVSAGDALEYVLGYCNANDVSDRGLQYRTGQWLLGKTPDGFLPLGPEVVTADEAGDPQDMAIRGWLNGELRQDSHTSDMIFSVAQIIAYASQYMTLEPGDVVSTGTPAGVILGRDPKDWLKPGDEYVVEVGPLGRLVTRFSAG